MTEFIKFLKTNYKCFYFSCERNNIEKEKIFNITLLSGETYITHKLFLLIDDYLVIINKINDYQFNVNYNITQLDSIKKNDKEYIVLRNFYKDLIEFTISCETTFEYIER